MHDALEPKLAKWPFFLGNILLLGAAGFIRFQTSLPMAAWQVVFLVLCVAGGAGLAVLPFLLEYRLRAKLVALRELGGVTAQMRNLEAIASQINGATAQWMSVQEGANKTAAAAKAIAERMAGEVKGFNEFMQRANDSERANLRLEVDKLRRTEAEWLQVVVRMLDHVYALHVAAVRSGQPNLIEQMSHFQEACRDAARRVGVMPYAAKEAEPFNAERHQLLDGDGKAQAGTPIAETIATGFTFQGRLLRPALVRLQTQGQGRVPSTGTDLSVQALEAQSQLALGAAGQSGR